MSILLGSAYGKVNLDASGVRRGVNQAKGAFGELEGAGRKLIGVFTAIAGAITIKKMADFAQQSVLAAARVSELATINAVLAKNAGLSEEAVRKEADAVRSMGIEAAASEQIIAEFVRNNLKLSQASKLARVAQDAATISGKNSTEATMGLINAIVTLQPEVARTYGMTVDFNAAYKELANTLGISTQELTSAQKQQAALNAVLEAGVQVAGAYEAAMTKGSKVIRSFPRYLNDIMVNIGTPFLSSFDKAAVATGHFMKGLVEATKEGGDLYPMLQRLAESAGIMVEHFVDFIENVDFVKLAEDLEPVLQGMIDLMTYVIDHGDLIIGILITIGKLMATAFVVKKGYETVMFFKTLYDWAVKLGFTLPIIKAEMFGISSILSGSLGPAFGSAGAAAGTAGVSVGGFGAALATIGTALLVALPALAILYFAFKYNFGGIRTTAEQLWFILKYGFKKMFASIAVTMGQLGFLIEYAFKNAWASVKAETQAALADWGNSLKGTWEKLVGFFNKLKQGIVDLFHMDWSQFGKLIIFGIVNGIMGAIPWLASAVKLIAGTILGGLKKALGIRSPSTEGELFGRMVAKGLVQGMQSEKAALTTAAKDVASSVVTQFANAQAAFKHYIQAGGLSGGAQFKAATSGNMKAAFANYLKESGFSGKGEFKPPTSSNMQAAFAQYAQGQAGKKPAPDPFIEKSKPVKTEMPIVMNFEKGLTTKEAHDIYSEKLGDVLSFLEKRLEN